MPNRILVLVGLRAAGKSTLGAAVAARVGWAFADTDDVLGREVGMPAGDLLRIAGEPAFRAAEERVVCAVLGAAGSRVVALGGGAVGSPLVRAVLRAPRCMVAELAAPPPVLAARLRAAKVSRPPLTDRTLEQEIIALAALRAEFFASVRDFQLGTSVANVDECSDALVAKMQAAAWV